MCLKICLQIGLAMASPEVALARDPALGTWRLNAGQSKPGGATAVPKTMAVREQEGQWIRVTAVFAQPGGGERRETYRMKRDSQDYPVTGALHYNTVSSIAIDRQSIETVFKRDGREVSRCTAHHAPDGQTSEVRCSTGGGAKGKTPVSIWVWQREGNE
jgi:hypothetical protein